MTSQMYIRPAEARSSPRMKAVPTAMRVLREEVFSEVSREDMVLMHITTSVGSRSCLIIM